MQWLLLQCTIVNLYPLLKIEYFCDYLYDGECVCLNVYGCVCVGAQPDKSTTLGFAHHVTMVVGLGDKKILIQDCSKIFVDNDD